MNIQLMLFEETFEVRLEKEVQKQTITLDRMRKKLFAENNILKKEMKALREELEFLNSNLCKGKNEQMSTL